MARRRTTNVLYPQRTKKLPGSGYEKTTGKASDVMEAIAETWLPKHPGTGRSFYPLCLDILSLVCGIRTMVVRKLPKLETRVRFSYPAPI